MQQGEIIEFFRSELLGPQASDQTTPFGQLDGVAISKQRSECLRKIHLIAHAVGPVKTRKDVLMILKETTRVLSHDDEVLFYLAKAYLTLADYVGGEGYQGLLFQPLIQLTMQEETAVRDTAVSSICELVHRTTSPKDVIKEHITPSLALLLKNDWCGSRISAITLITKLYPYASDSSREEMRLSYITLCSDDVLLVRRHALRGMAELISHLQPKHISTAILTKTDRGRNREGTDASDKGRSNSTSKDPPASNMLQATVAAWAESSDSMRLTVIPIYLELAAKLTPLEIKQHVLPFVSEASEDRSWIIRRSLAQHIDVFLRRLPDKQGAILPAFQALLQDTVVDVREEATKALNRILGGQTLRLPQYFLQEMLNAGEAAGSKGAVKENQSPIATPENIQQFLLPCFAPLVNDSSAGVRAQIAECIPKVAEPTEKKDDEPQTVSLLLRLLGDETHEVKLAAVMSTGAVYSQLKVNSSSHSLVVASINLMQDFQWRVRLGVLQQLETLVTLVRRQQFETDLMEQVYFPCLKDRVCAIRLAAIRLSEVLAKHFGDEWTEKYLWPRLLQTYGYSSTGVFLPSGSYLDRRNIIEVAGVLVPHAAQSLAANLLALIIEHTRDKVVGVRLACTRVLSTLIKANKLSTTMITKMILPEVDQLVETEEEVDMLLALTRLRALLSDV